MAETYFIGDTHFNHTKIVQYGRDFPTWEDHDEYVIKQWNQEVRSQDKVYLLGDVHMGHKGIDKLSRLNGKISIVLGNHDMGMAKDYLKHVSNVRACKEFKGGILATHIPVHPDCLNRRSMQYNVHGHLHKNIVYRRNLLGIKVPDKRYLCVSCEQIDYTPVPLYWVKEQFNIKH